MNAEEVKRTPLCRIHEQLGARMVDYAGWKMPVQYSGPIQEHVAVRTRVGIFDVSHMGEVVVVGDGALETVQKLTCNDAARLSIGQCHYSALITPAGTFVDDILVYRRAQNRFLLVVNCANQEKDFLWAREHAVPGGEVHFLSDEFSQLAVQGPRALDILEPLTDIRLRQMKYYWFAEGKFCGAEAIVSRTGYTGEDGFEIYIPPKAAEGIWGRIMEEGRTAGIEPAGLAARNTLRLEAKMPLYGNDNGETTTVFEADLGWICKLEKGDFIGRDALLAQQSAGITRKLVGFEMAERGIARDHYPIEIAGREIGAVTSGSPAPFLQKNIGLAYLPLEMCALGTEFHVIIRGRPVKARVVPTPFYRRQKS
jgi:aminomethyltransferase